MLYYEVFIEWILKHSVPPLYKHIVSSQATTLAMVQLAVSDPQRRLQQQLLKINARAYMSGPDSQHLILQGISRNTCMQQHRATC